jgi:hypothetical protein
MNVLIICKDLLYPASYSPNLLHHITPEAGDQVTGSGPGVYIRRPQVDPQKAAAAARPHGHRFMKFARFFCLQSKVSRVKKIFALLNKNYHVKIYQTVNKKRSSCTDSKTRGT